MDSPSSEQSEDENVLLEDTSDSEQCEEEISTEPDVVTAGSLSDLWQVVASISQTVQTMQESDTLLRRNTERILEYMGEYQSAGREKTKSVEKTSSQQTRSLQDSQEFYFPDSPAIM